MLKNSLMAAAMTAAAFCLPAPANAAPAATLALPAIANQTASKYELVQSRQFKRRRWNYNRARHGPRFRHRHGAYSHYYGGWWYPRAWWGSPGVAIGIGPGYGGGYGYYGGGYGYGGGYADYDDYDGEDYAYAGGGYGGGDRHVRWCLNRYRSYDPRSDSFMGYDGYRHRCNSPF